MTGRAAQFGRGLMEDVAGHLLQQFARGLEAAVLGREEVAPARPAAAELDLGAAAWQPLLRRYGPFIAVGVSGFILGLAFRRR